MKNKTYRIIAYVLAVLPIIVMLLIYNKLPNQVPTHWGIDGTVTYGSKNTMWYLTFLSIVIVVMFDFLPKIDPRKKNYEKFSKYYDGFCIFMAAFTIILEGIIVSESFWPGRISVSKVIMILVGLMFLFLGNMMPKVKSNFYVGIKNPWTLSNTDVWNRAHRLGGILMFVSGIALIIASFTLTNTIIFYLLMGIVAVITFIPSIMSFVWYRTLPKEESDI